MPYLRSLLFATTKSFIAFFERTVRSRWPRPYRTASLFYGFFISAMLFALVEPTAESVGIEPRPRAQIAVEAAVERHAPEVRFHPQERYFPSSVEWFLDKTAVDEPPGPASSPDDRLVVSPEADAEKVRAGNLKGARAYVHTKSAPGGERAVDIQYWFFYPYSGPVMDGPAGGAHEGDWEHVTVRTDESRRRIRRVYFAAHDSEGRWVEPPGLRMSHDGHPIVYSARYGHASYPRPGLQSRGMLPGDRTADGGARWETWRSLAVVAEDGRPTPEHRWLEFPGSWGRTGSLFAAPQSPLHQDYWEGS
ncbi:MAG: Vps62-related protein [Persicimonas sp.]